jgi:hypothetical protein
VARLAHAPHRLQRSCSPDDRPCPNQAGLATRAPNLRAPQRSSWQQRAWYSLDHQSSGCPCRFRSTTLRSATRAVAAAKAAATTKAASTATGKAPPYPLRSERGDHTLDVAGHDILGQ